MKLIDELRNTNNSSAFNKLYRKFIGLQTGKCPICRPHRGENRWELQRSWKKFRKNQWKENEN